MKKLISYSLGAILVTGALTTVSNAQTQSVTVTESPVTSMGTITEFSPDTIMITTSEGTQPVRYGYSKTTTYVDELGKPVSMDLVKSGVPVTVYYTKTGNTMVASKVVVRKTTTTTTTPSVKQQHTTTIPSAVKEEKKTTTTTTTSP